MLIGFSIAKHGNAFRMTDRSKKLEFLRCPGVCVQYSNSTAVEQCCPHIEVIADCYGQKPGVLLGTLYVSVPKYWEWSGNYRTTGLFLFSESKGKLSVWFSSRAMVNCFHLFVLTVNSKQNGHLYYMGSLLYWVIDLSLTCMALWRRNIQKILCALANVSKSVSTGFWFIASGNVVNS